MLAGELKAEIEEIDRRLPKVKLMTTALGGHEWTERRDELFDCARDANRLGAEEGRAVDRVTRIEALAQFMRTKNVEIDKTLDELAGNMKTAKDADEALTKAIPLAYERELSVLFLRAINTVEVICDKLI